MTWHDDIDARVKYGYEAEEKFGHHFVCICGTAFKHERTFNTDFNCQNCGRLVDVKRTGDPLQVNISKTPFETSPPETYHIILVDIGERWIGKQKQYIPDEDVEGPYSPAHKGKFATDYYRINLRSFMPAENYLKRKNAT